MAASFSYGEKDYYLGGSPIWQLFRVVYRARKQPIDGLALLSGYCWAALRRIKRPVSSELMRFHRQEQMAKLRSIFRALLRFKKVDSFRAVTSGTKSDDRGHDWEMPNSQHPTLNKIEGKKMENGRRGTKLRAQQADVRGLTD